MAEKVKFTLRDCPPDSGRTAATAPRPPRPVLPGQERTAPAGGLLPFPGRPPTSGPARRPSALPGRPSPAGRLPACSAEEGTESTITNPAAAVSAALPSPRRCLRVLSPRPLGSDGLRSPFPRPLTQSRGAWPRSFSARTPPSYPEFGAAAGTGTRRLCRLAEPDGQLVAAAEDKAAAEDGARGCRLCCCRRRRRCCQVGAVDARVFLPPLAPRPRWARARGPAGWSAARAPAGPAAGPCRCCLAVAPNTAAPEAQLGCGRRGVGSPAGLAWASSAGAPRMPACLSAPPAAWRERRVGRDAQAYRDASLLAVTPAGLSPNGAFDLRNPRVELGRGRTKRTVGETERERSLSRTRSSRIGMKLLLRMTQPLPDPTDRFGIE